MQCEETEEMVFHFRTSQIDFPDVTIGIERVFLAKILGVTIQSDLKWNSHISNMIKKANKRFYLLRGDWGPMSRFLHIWLLKAGNQTKKTSNLACV